MQLRIPMMQACVVKVKLDTVTEIVNMTFVYKTTYSLPLWTEKTDG